MKVACPACGGTKDYYAKTCRRCAQRPITERIRDGSIPEPTSGCWLWLGGTTRSRSGSNYGHLSIADRTVLAHRASYEAFRGPIPPGFELDHRCKVTICVNPWHVEPVSHKVNQERGLGSKAQCKRGHPFDEQNTAYKTNRRLGKTQRVCRRCDSERHRLAS